MQHGAPPHSVLPVRAWLGKYFPRWWIGRGEKRERPPRTPDRTGCDFFFLER